MSDKSDGTAPKRRASPMINQDDSISPEKRLSGGGSALGGKLGTKISTWGAYEPDSVNNILEKLHLNRQCIIVPDDNLTGFISDRPGSFQCQQMNIRDQDFFEEYLRILDICMDFEVENAVLKVRNVKYQYGGYDRVLPNATKTSDEVKAVFSKFDSCFRKLEDYVETVNEDFKPLARYCHYAMDFIEAATKILMSPTEWQERAFEDLFRVFCRMAGLQLQDAAFEAPRQFHIFGENISGQPDLRAHIPVNNETWWRQKPVSSHTMPFKQTLSAVVKVKLSPPRETGSIEQETAEHLSQVVGEMLGELLCCNPYVPVAASAHTHLLGILVLSTKVYFIKLYIPPSLLDMYQYPASRCKEEDIEKGTVYVTQGFDFMKRKTRHQVLKILHKIGRIICT